MVWHGAGTEAALVLAAMRIATVPATMMVEARHS